MKKKRPLETLDPLYEKRTMPPKLTQVVGPNTVVHPGAVVVHAADASVANTTMMRHGRLEGLALATHAVRVLHQSLALRWDSCQRNTTGIG